MHSGCSARLSESTITLVKGWVVRASHWDIKWQPQRSWETTIFAILKRLFLQFHETAMGIWFPLLTSEKKDFSEN